MTPRIKNYQLVPQQIVCVLLQHQHSAEDQTCGLWRASGPDTNIYKKTNRYEHADWPSDWNKMKTSIPVPVRLVECKLAGTSGDREMCFSVWVDDA